MSKKSDANFEKSKANLKKAAEAWNKKPPAQKKAASKGIRIVKPKDNG